MLQRDSISCTRKTFDCFYRAIFRNGFRTDVFIQMWSKMALSCFSYRKFTLVHECLGSIVNALSYDTHKYLKFNPMSCYSYFFKIMKNLLCQEISESAAYPLHLIENLLAMRRCVVPGPWFGFRPTFRFPPLDRESLSFVFCTKARPNSPDSPVTYAWFTVRHAYVIRRISLPSTTFTCIPRRHLSFFGSVYRSTSTMQQKATHSIIIWHFLAPLHTTNAKRSLILMEELFCCDCAIFINFWWMLMALLKQTV